MHKKPPISGKKLGMPCGFKWLQYVTVQHYPATNHPEHRLVSATSTPEPSDSRSSSFMAASERYRKHQMLNGGFI